MSYKVYNLFFHHVGHENIEGKCIDGRLGEVESNMENEGKSFFMK